MNSHTVADLRVLACDTQRRVIGALTALYRVEQRVDVLLSWKLSKDVRKDLVDIQRLIKDAIK